MQSNSAEIEYLVSLRSISCLAIFPIQYAYCQPVRKPIPSTCTGINGNLNSNFTNCFTNLINFR